MARLKGGSHVAGDLTVEGLVSVGGLQIDENRTIIFSGAGNLTATQLPVATTGNEIIDSGIIVDTVTPLVTIPYHSKISGNLEVTDNLTVGSIYMEDTGASAHLLRLISSSSMDAAKTLTIDVNNANRTLTITGNSTINQNLSTTATPQFNAVKVYDGSHYLTLGTATDLTVDHSLTFATGNADRTLTLSGNPTLGNWFNQSVKTTNGPTFTNLYLSNAAPLIQMTENDQTDPAGRWRIVADSNTFSIRKRESAGTWTGETYILQYDSLNRLKIPGKIYKTGQEDNSFGFDASDSWNVVTNGTEKLGISNAQLDVAVDMVGVGTADISGFGKVYNAVWNDIADFIQVEENTKITFGKVYIKDKKGHGFSNKYCQRGIVGIASDTFGFGVGQKKKGKEIPIAIGGFVLARVDKVYPSGSALTSTKDGCLTKAGFLAKMFFPERIVATFYKEESEEIWNDKIVVDGRHWVKVK